MSQVDTDQNLQLLETLKNELHHCQAECNQTQLFLTEICNRLHSTQELITKYHVSAKIQSDRIIQLEQQLELKSKQLEAVNFEHEELRKRIKSEKHNASQYKAALHRCLDTSQLDEEEAKQIYNQAHILASSNSESYSESYIEPTATSFHQADTAQTQMSPSTITQNLTDNSNLANLKQSINHAIDRQLSSPNIQPKSHKVESRRVEVPIAAPVTKDITEERPKSLAAIKLPQFAPLKPR